MIKEAVFHLNTGEYIYPVSRNQLVVRLKATINDVRCCQIVFWPRTDAAKKQYENMIWKYKDELFDYFQVNLFFHHVARYQKYYFVIETTKGKKLYYSVYGLTEKEPEAGFFEYLYANAHDVVATPEWAEGMIYYHIFPERFCDGNPENNPKNCMPWGTRPTAENYMGGDLQGIIDKIDYLKELGAECLYINPVFEGDFNHKYAITDYYKIDPEFGTNELFSQLVQKYHQAGIRVILDGVFNHTGINFAPFQDLLKNGKNSKFCDWYHVTKFPVEISHHSYECVGAYKWMPKLNTSNSEVRAFILDVMEYWIREYDIDGWRLDVADEVDISVWQSAAVYLKEKYPNIILLGETWQYGGKLIEEGRLDSVMNYMFRDSVRDYFGVETISVNVFEQRISHMLAFYKEETNRILYNLLDSHDTERFLFYCKNDIRKFKLAIAFQMLFPGAPTIYYGDEQGLSGANDPDCRKCMIWDDTGNTEIFEWYKKLIGIRKQFLAVRKGEYTTILSDEKKDVLIFMRQWKAQRIYVVLHKGEKSEIVLCPVESEAYSYENVIDELQYTTVKLSDKARNGNTERLGYSAAIELNMKPYSIAVIKEQER